MSIVIKINKQRHANLKKSIEKKPGMIRYALGGLTAITLFCCLTYNMASASENSVIMHKNVTVRGDYVRLGDIFSPIENHDLFDIVIARAPKPGSKLVLDNRFLSKTAKLNGIYWQPEGYSDISIVYRSSSTIHHEAIQKSLLEKLTEDHNIDPQEWLISFDQKDSTIHLPSDIEANFVIEALTLDETNGHFSADIIAPSHEMPLIKNRLTGKLQQMAQIPVLRTQTKTGQVIKESDLIYLRIPKGKINPEIIQDRAHLVGYTPKRIISANMPIQQFDIMAPVLIMKGSTATVTLISEHLNLTTKATALENGSKGERIRLLNPQSKITIEAEVIGLNQARVDSPFDLAFQNNQEQNSTQAVSSNNY